MCLHTEVWQASWAFWTHSHIWKIQSCHVERNHRGEMLELLGHTSEEHSIYSWEEIAAILWRELCNIVQLCFQIVKEKHNLNRLKHLLLAILKTFDSGNKCVYNQSLWTNARYSGQALINNISQQNYCQCKVSRYCTLFAILLPFTPCFTVLYICEIIVK